MNFYWKKLCKISQTKGLKCKERMGGENPKNFFNKRNENVKKYWLKTPKIPLTK